MKIIISAALAAAAIALGTPAVASAGTGICDNHMDQKDASFGYASSGSDPQDIAACEGDNGPDYANNAQPPSISTAPVGGQAPATSQGTNQGDSGTYDETQGVADEDGIQGHDNVKDGNLFVPQARS